MFLARDVWYTTIIRPVASIAAVVSIYAIVFSSSLWSSQTTKSVPGYSNLWQAHAGCQWAALPNWWARMDHSVSALKRLAKNRGCLVHIPALTGSICHHTKVMNSLLKSWHTPSRRQTHLVRSKWISRFHAIIIKKKKNVSTCDIV